MPHEDCQNPNCENKCELGYNFCTDECQAEYELNYCGGCDNPYEECACEPDYDPPDDYYDGPDVDYIYTPPHLYM